MYVCVCVFVKVNSNFSLFNSEAKVESRTSVQGTSLHHLTFCAESNQVTIITWYQLYQKQHHLWGASNIYIYIYISPRNVLKQVSLILT